MVLLLLGFIVTISHSITVFCGGLLFVIADLMFCCTSVLCLVSTLHTYVFKGIYRTIIPTCLTIVMQCISAHLDWSFLI